ncbi:symmetrical bis(5'-nucleosyl)-tetraphosphatase [Methyloversatilis sp. XJ19-13]|uniref:symmetrical bis(5'-nucleosyl)-tetraphosphatase n=1 Tax=Methyloversatilis sp. XJ19-13 TaxID=2963430 RepID=UPI00211CA274|nr:symmetrical bis(5'-nucleosyl)-tetraphosphatase [Methyloversatilis sp. XJ19-13]MCQ9376047.1 symmetrical bis(5'-nucleosyl)-tetraphosphatase [Methyloversatilis sp. XJ19-13]
MSTYAIGDLQGCFDPLEALLEHCGFDRRHDRLWFVGDLVNRGPKSLETLRFVRDLGDAAVTVLGNHDLSLLMIAAGQGKRHRLDTFHHVLDAPDGDELIDWLRQRPMMHVEGDYAMVHAGLLPQWDIAQALALAHEVEAALRGPQSVEFMQRMWGSEPAQWRDDLHGWDRLRIVVNALTRMRFCTPDGRMEFHSKGAPEEPPDGYLPWFDNAAARWRSHTVVCGHWSALGYRTADHVIALDSGCLWGGALTALRLDDRAVFQVPCERCATF